MTKTFNDSPISKPEDDLYGITQFTQSLAKSIQHIASPIGTTIALNGKWGSGKTSAVNIIRNELERSNDQSLVISDFKCWWYRGQEALLLAFLQNLNSLLTTTLSDKAKELIPRLGECLLQAGPVIGSALAMTPAAPFAVLTGAGIKFAERYFPQGETLETTFNELADALNKQEKRFLIIVDDIDRLNSEEALAIFRTIKSVGCLPNVIYLLVFDRDLADEMITRLHPSEGPHFLEKIVQASFELPTPLQADLNESLLSAIQATCGELDESAITRFLNVFYDVVVPHMTTPRHVVRLSNAIRITWPAIAGEVSVADYIALETLRLYEPSLFQAIRANRQNLCDIDEYDGLNRKVEDKFKPYLTGVREGFHEAARVALMRLFPRMKDAHYGPEFHSEWDAERRICVEQHFDTYFRLSLTDDTLSMNEIDELIERADDREFVHAVFHKAASKRRRYGLSMVPVTIDALNTHAGRISDEKIQPLLAALFEIHDEVDLSVDDGRGLMAIESTTLRYHWLIRRLTTSRFDIDQRTDLYISALENASLGWLVDFVSSAWNDYHGSKDPQREGKCLVSEDAAEKLRKRALDSIQLSANDGTLLAHQDLIYILYRWRDFLGNDPSEIRAWTDPLLEKPDALVTFARQLTGEGWSQGSEDRVARTSIKAHIDKRSDILDVKRFRGQLGTLQLSGSLNGGDQETIDTFLGAWREREDAEDSGEPISA